MPSNIGKLLVQIGVNTAEFNKGINDVKKSLNGIRNIALFDAFNNINSNPLVQIGKDAIVMAAKFETAFLKIKNLTGSSAADLTQYQASINTLSNKLGVSALNLADSLYTITSSGASGAKALEILETAAKGAAVGMGTADEVARVLTATTNSYRASGLSAARAAEILFNTTKIGSLDIKDLTANMANVTPLAAEMGVSLEQVGAFLSTVSLNGTGASEAITQLRSVLDAILAPSEQAKDILKEMGISVSELQQLAGTDLHAALLKLKEGFNGNNEAVAKFFGRKEAVLGFFSAMGSNAKVYEDALLSLLKNTNNFGRSTNEALETAEQKWARLSARISNFSRSAGGILINTLDTLVKFYDRFVPRNPFFKEDPNVIASEIGQVNQAIAPLITNLRTLGGFSNQTSGVSAISSPFVPSKTGGGAAGSSGAAGNVIKEEADSLQLLRESSEQLTNTLSNLSQNTLSYKQGLEDLKLVTQAIYEIEQKRRAILDQTSQATFDNTQIARKDIKEVVPNLQVFAGGELDGKVPKGLDVVFERTSEFKRLLEETGLVMEGIGAASAEAFAGIAADLFTGALAFKDLGKAALGAARNIVNAALAEALAGLFAKEIGTKGLIGIGIAVAGAALVATLFKSKIPKLAGSGYAYGPGLAVIGDNPSARIDPEVVTPISRLRSMIEDVIGNPKSTLSNNSFGNGLHLSGSFRVAGSDLVLALDRGRAVQRRQRGYN